MSDRKHDEPGETATEDEGVRISEFDVGDERLVVVSLPLHPDDWPESLTAAEREVACAVIEGKSNAEIAAERDTSTSTVSNQIGSIYRKIGVSSRQELAGYLHGICDE